MSFADNDESGTSKSNMKISLQSENTMTSAEDDDADLEEVIWNLMGKSGLLTDIKGKILNFIQNQDQIEASLPETRSDRVDANILTAIYEYLRWVGMKYTCATIQSESPVKLNLNDLEQNVEQNENYKPLLCHMFEKSKSDNDVDIISDDEPPIVKNNNVLELQENIQKATGDEINSSAIDAFNKTYITSTSTENQMDEHEPEKFKAGVMKEICNDKVSLSENTYGIPEFEASKETGDSCISGGDVIHNVESKNKAQDFSVVGKSDSDDFEEESLLEIVDDLSLEKDNVIQSIPSVPSLITFADGGSTFQDGKYVNEIGDSIEQEGNKIGDENPVISKDIEDKSDNSILNDCSKSKVNDISTTAKSESHHFEEESISELLEDISSDNTEDVTIPPENKDIDKDCDYVIKLS